MGRLTKQGRKFLVFQQVFLIATGLVYFGKIDPTNYVILVSLCTSAYLGFNVWQKKVTNGKT